MRPRRLPGEALPMNAGLFNRDERSRTDAGPTAAGAMPGCAIPGPSQGGRSRRRTRSKLVTRPYGGGCGHVDRVRHPPGEDGDGWVAAIFRAMASHEHEPGGALPVSSG